MRRKQLIGQVQAALALDKESLTPEDLNVHKAALVSLSSFEYRSYRRQTKLGYWRTPLARLLGADVMDPSITPAKAR